MKRTTLAFLGLAFLTYWYSTNDTSFGKKDQTLDLIVPASVTPVPAKITSPTKKAKIQEPKAQNH